MNISYKWLKEYVDVDLSASQIAEALTSIGLEVGSVEEVQAIKGGLEGLVVGEVVEIQPHPNSDHMHVCQVNLGTDELVQIVCGAANVDKGQKVIVATLGTKLYSSDECFTIKRSKLRGVESLGMICAEDEIGVGTSHDGIIVLPADTVVGTKAADYFNIKSDWLIEVDITPNRADACSHWGVARDLYAWLVRNGYKTALRRPSVDEFTTDNQNLPISVKVENTEACPRYCAVTISGVQVAESPEWLKEKLEIIGLRPINNIVDVTNYVMMAYGQPLHCFDADMIEGKEIRVRTMPECTPFVTLDGVEHKLSERDLAICNASEPMCIAGVFGGKGSGTYDTTTNILLESAYFHPTWIRKSSRRHALQTDASFRFERGIDPDGQIYALKRAAMLIKELAGGEISMDIVDVEAPGLPKYFEVEVEYEYINALIGKQIPKETVKEILTSLEYRITEETETLLNLQVPAYRVDVCRAPDVVEDVLRIYGYNNVEIPTAVKSSLTIKGKVDTAYKLENLISEQLVGCGFNEILNNSLTREAYYSELKTHSVDHLVKLMNPLSSDLNAMRQSLLFGGLESISHNINRRNANLRFFEFGNCYKRDEAKRNANEVLSAYSEDAHLGLWLTGKSVENSWAHPNEESSIYQLKAHVANILVRMNVPMAQFVVNEGQNDVFAKSIAIADRNGRVFAELGLVKKAILHAFDIEQDVYFADLNWSLLTAQAKSTITFKEISKYPSVSRDLALLVDKTTTFQQIENVCRQAEKKLLKNVELFDVYEGKNLPEGKKSYAINLLLQDETKTMNDKQTDAIMQKIITQLQKQLNVTLR
ncbi:MAG: phenylalanine--tRNA ligase subunit beta [Bacteroidaceae bacterium]|nr:phenylalanine--tRNA ligase subunit beta [Bacteroidaceae bacterium]